MITMCCRWWQCWHIIVLDLSAAFDTIDHQKLIKCLPSQMGIDGTAVSWFSSYLSGRRQSVVIAYAIYRRVCSDMLCSARMGTYSLSLAQIIQLSFLRCR